MVLDEGISINCVFIFTVCMNTNCEISYLMCYELVCAYHKYSDFKTILLVLFK